MKVYKVSIPFLRNAFQARADRQCAVMGCGGVGKSAVTVRSVNGMYLEWYDPTSELI
jgi:GTPase SAR1 family protein